MIGLWDAQLKDIYRQQYLNLSTASRWATGPWAPTSATSSARKTAAERPASWTTNRVRPALGQVPGHTFYVGLQKVSGDDAWMRVNGTSGGTLANDSYNSSFDNAKEKSWQVRHDFNFVALGVPGLTLMNRYISGDNVTREASPTARNGAVNRNWPTRCRAGS
jgi:hypothetical protein